MKQSFYALLLAAGVAGACTTSNNAGIEGTWKLLRAQTITGKDTLETFPVPGQEMIKVINASHFAFFRHDNKRGKDTGNVVFDAGGGTYTLKGSNYSESLEYCTARSWEGQSFDFQVKLTGDSLIQTGTEKIENLGVDRQIIEVYKRMR